LSIAIAEVVMGNVFVHTMMSLDGFIAGPNDDMSWVFRHAGDMPGAVVDEVIARTGAVLAGRRVYEVGRRVQRPEARGLFDGRWRGPHFILTHAPPTDETDPSFSFLFGDVRDAVATALTAAGGRDVLVLAATKRSREYAHARAVFRSMGGVRNRHHRSAFTAAYVHLADASVRRAPRGQQGAVTTRTPPARRR
jgi:dihydrofolate reductase